MSVDAELIAAIVAAPDDDGLRMVYADHLMQRGDPRGELIALQCQLARADAADAQFDDAVISRERELREAHAASWTTDLCEIVDAGYVFSRGFVDHVVTWKSSDIAHRPQPAIEELVPGEPVDRTDRLAALLERAPLLRALTSHSDLIGCELTPAWEQLRALTLLGRSARAEQITAWIGSPHLQGLRRLQLSHTSLDNDEARAWLAMRQPLEHLGIHFGWHIELRIDPALVVTEIASNPALRGLRSLHLSGLPLTDVARLRCLENLERLAITRCGVPGDELVELVAKLPRLAMLELQPDMQGGHTASGELDESLARRDDPLCQLDVPALLAAAPRLTRLALSGYPISPAGVRALGAASTLRRLVISRGELGDGGTTFLLDSKPLDRLVMLGILDDKLADLTKVRLADRALRYAPPPPRYLPAVVEQLPASKIMAIKLLREHTGIGLGDAKMAVERIEEQRTGVAAYQHVRSMSYWCG